MPPLGHYQRLEGVAGCPLNVEWMEHVTDAQYVAGVSAEYRGSLARIFITSSTKGLGRAAARSLLDERHEVVLHARSTERTSTLAEAAGS